MLKCCLKLLHTISPYLVNDDERLRWWGTARDSVLNSISLSLSNWLTLSLSLSNWPIIPKLHGYGFRCSSLFCFYFWDPFNVFFFFFFFFLDFSYFILIPNLKKMQNGIVSEVLTAVTNWVVMKSCIDKN